MVTQELLDYVQAEIARGIEKDAIAQALVASGWPVEDAKSAISALAQPPQPPPQMSVVPVVVSAPQVVVEPTAPVLIETESVASASIPVQATPTTSPIAKPVSSLEAKAAKIEMTYDTAVEKVNEIGGQQRQIVTDSVKKLEERKIDEIKKRLLPS